MITPSVSSSDLISKMHQKTPLVELIAELHWKLEILARISGSKTDPFYHLLQKAFISN